VSRYRAGADALAATLADGAVLLNLRTNRYHSLNETGARVWQLLLEGHAEEEIAKILPSEYDVTEEVARVEIAAIIAALKAAQLLVPNDD
jgi:hypothetical protein